MKVPDGVPEGSTLDPCTVCGATIEGWSEHRDLPVIESEMQPMWDGGPLVEVPLMYPKHGKPGPWVMTVHPCEHVQEAMIWRHPNPAA